MTANDPPTKSSSSWISVVFVATFILIAQSLFLGPLSSYDEALPSIRLPLVTLAVGVLLVAFVRRTRWDRKTATVLFLLLFVPLYGVAWASHGAAARAGEPWIPFEAFRAYLVVLAVLIPGPYWVNVILMLGFIVEAIALWTVLDLPRVETALLWHEPWLTGVYVVIAGGLLAFRVAHDRMARDLERSRSRAEMLEQVARIFLSVRDRTNTPLQTLKLAVTVLRAKHPEVLALAELMSRSTDRIVETSALLSRFESKVMSRHEDLLTDEEILRMIEQT